MTLVLLFGGGLHGTDLVRTSTATSPDAGKQPRIPLELNFFDAWGSWLFKYAEPVAGHSYVFDCLFLCPISHLTSCTERPLSGVIWRLYYQLFASRCVLKFKPVYSGGYISRLSSHQWTKNAESEIVYQSVVCYYQCPERFSAPSSFTQHIISLVTQFKGLRYNQWKHVFSHCKFKECIAINFDV